MRLSRVEVSRYIDSASNAFHGTVALRPLALRRTPLASTSWMVADGNSCPAMRAVTPTSIPDAALVISHSRKPSPMSAAKLTGSAHASAPQSNPIRIQCGKREVRQ